MNVLSSPSASRSSWNMIRALAMGAALTLSGVALAQTTLVNENFEGATGFLTANAATNAWSISTATASGGAKSGYISNDLGVTNNYTNTLTQVSHLYVPINVPAGESAILLSFDWKGNGDWDASTDFDYLRVSVTAAAPVAGTAPALADQIPVAFAGQDNFTKAWVNLPAALAGAGPRFLVFTWINDASVGAGPGAAVDNVSLISNIPAPLSGTRTIPGNYASIGEAIANVNAHGANTAGGSLVFNVAAGSTFIESPGALTVSGSSASNRIIFQRSGAGANPKIIAEGSGSFGPPSLTSTASTHAVIALNTCDFVTFDGIDVASNNVLSVAPWTAIDAGYLLRNTRILANVTTIDGAQNNIIKNCAITLERRKIATITSTGILQTATTSAGGAAPTSAAQANSGNVYQDFSITNAYAGVNLLGTAAFPDLGCQIVTASCTAFNTIGDPAIPNDIGGGLSTNATFGINASNQSGVIIRNNRVRNVTNTTGQIDGINLVLGQGICEVSNNIVRGIRRNSTTGTTALTGIRVSHSTTGTVEIRVFNNAVSEITSAYTSTATATKVIKGIFLAGATGSTSNTYAVHNNSVSIDGSGSPNVSNDCIETAQSASVFIVKNNVFANFTAAQGATARHFGVAHTAAATIGGAGSSWTNNDIFIAADVNVSGFTAQGSTTNYNGVAAWAAAITSPVGAVAGNLEVAPSFTDNAGDLHAGAAALNGAAILPPAYITTDLDCATRTPDNDIGAYLINACSGPTAGTISGTLSVCSGVSNTLSLSGASNGLGISYQWKYGPVGGPYGNLMGTSANQSTSSLAIGTYGIVCDVTCSSGPVTATTPEAIFIVKPVPTASASSNSPLCAGLPLNLNGTTDIGTSFAWSGPNAFSSTSQSPQVSASATVGMTGAYSFTATLNGCTSTPSLTSAQVKAGPVLSSTTATPNPTCFNGNSQLQVNESTAFKASSGALDPMAGAATLLTTGNDDTPTATSSPIGFSFVFNGTPYTDFSVSPDGWILLGTTVATSQFTNATTSTSNIPKIYPYWDDLATGTTGNVTSVVTGVAPNRILKVQWFVTIPRNTTGAANSTFQAWLYENGGQIDFRYGAMGPGAMSASVGTTTSATVFRSVTISSNTLSTVAANDANAVQPASGLMYSFNHAASSYLWTPNTFLNFDNIANPLVSGFNLASQAYTVTATNADNCTATGTVTLTTTAPITDATISGTLHFCTGGSTTLTAVPADGGAPFSYLWSPGGATTASIVVTSPGNYYCNVFDACGGLEATNIVNVVQNALPVVSVSPAPPANIWNQGSLAFTNAGGVGTDNITAQTALTRGTSLPIYNSACQAGALQSCSWTPCNTEWAYGTIANWNTLTYSNLFIVNGCTPPSMVGLTMVCHLIAENIYFQVTWTGWGSGGSGGFSYTRTTGPTLTPYCTGSPAIPLTATGASTYSWSPAAGLDFTNVASVNASPSTTTLYTVTGTDGNGCQATASSNITVLGATPVITSTTATPGTICTNTTAQLQVNVAPPPAYCTSTHTSGCSGDNISNVTLNTLANATGTACGGTSHYTYFTGGGTQTTSLAVATPYTVSCSFGTDANQYFGAWIDYNNDGSFAASEFLGASANAGASGTIGVAFTVPATAYNGVLRLRIVGGNDVAVTATQACGVSSSPWGETQDYDVTITGGTAQYTYSWDNAATLNNAAIANPVSSADNNTTYQVTVTSQAGCSATGSASVIVNPAPVVTATASPAAVCEGSPVNFAASIAGNYAMGASTQTFIDISATGTSVGTASDDSEHTITFPSPFTFNGVAYTTARVGNNGALVFGATTGEITYLNTALPTANFGGAGAPGLAPYWDDLTPTTGGGASTLFTQTQGNLFIVQWKNEDHFDAPGTGTITFQVQLDLTNGTIHFVYSDVDFTGTAAQDKGGTATVGINFSASQALQYSFNTQSLVNGQAIQFSPVGTYAWTGPNGFTASTQNASLTAATTASTGAYTVTYTAANGCSNTATVNLSVNPTPVASCGGPYGPLCSTAAPLTLGGTTTTTLFYETFGSPFPGAAPASLYTGYTNGMGLTFPQGDISGDGSPFGAPPSTGYPGASGYAHAVCVPIVQLSNINAAGYSGLTLTFGAISSLGGGGLVVDFGSGSEFIFATNSWAQYSLALPATAAVNGLTISFLDGGGLPNIDDVRLTGTPVSAWSGSGVVGNTFDPAQANLGDNVLTYTATSPAGCSATCTTTITVNGVPTVPVITPAAPVATCAGTPVPLTATSLMRKGFTGGALTIPTSGNATPYPSSITVSGLPTSGVTVKKVRIKGFSHSYPNDVDVLLQSPTGTNVVIMSDAGSAAAAVNLNYAFQDGAATMVTNALNPSGTYAPFNSDTNTDNWSAPGPGAFAQATPTLALFTGNVNGTWNLLVRDDANGDAGSIANWNLELEYDGATYSWSPATGLTPTTGASVIASDANTQTYTVTANNAGCSAQGTVLVPRNALPVVSCGGPYAPVCGDAPDITLTGSPAGGTWSGTGVTGNAFDPSVGTQTLTYSYTDGNGCTNTCSITIPVIPVPVLSCPPASEVFVTASAFALTGASPAGGTYSGPGVSGGTFNPATAGLGTHTITYTLGTSLIYGASAFQDSLWGFDPTTYTVVTRNAPSLPGFTITGINGMAKHPTTGVVYAIAKVTGGRRLVTLNPVNGACTDIGPLGANFSSLTFHSNGTLYGVTGDGATPPETLFTINIATAATTLVTALGNGADGEIICFNPDDGLIYHWSGNATVVMESINPVTLAVTNIPHGLGGGEIFGAMYAGGGTFVVSNIASQFKTVTTTGTASGQLGPSSPDDQRGLVPFTACPVSCSFPITVTTPGDNVCSALSLVVGTNGLFTTVGATSQPGEPTPPLGACETQGAWCGGGGLANNSAWFSFVAPPSGRISLNFGTTQNWDSQIALWSAPNCNALLTGGAVLLAANDDITNAPPYHAAILPICVVAGQTYYVQVDGFGNTTNGAFQLVLVEEPGIGSVCNDGDPNTLNDVITAGCVCAGTPMVQLAPRVFLEGPYSVGTGLMNDYLRNLLGFPLTEPFTALGYVHHGGGGGESTTLPVISVTGPNAVVDWVVVELRSSADHTVVLASRSALVQRDGDVVAMDGVSPLLLPLPPASYKVAIRPRNHLGAMTDAAIALTGTSTTVDFTLPATVTYGTAAQKSIGTVMALWQGDVTRNGVIKYTGSANDRDPILTRIGGTVPTNIANGYFLEDCNLDGVVKYTGTGNDRDPILQNIGGTVPTNIRSQQLP